MAGESYEGWTNLATHRVNLWVMNDEPAYQITEDHKKFALWTAEAVKYFVTEEIGGSVFSGILSDLKGSGQNFKDVNWQELADTWNED